MCVCRDLFTHMCIDVGEGVAFTNAFVPEACTAVYFFFKFFFLPTSCLYAKVCIHSSGVRSSFARGSDVVILLREECDSCVILC